MSRKRPTAEIVRLRAEDYDPIEAFIGEQERWPRCAVCTNIIWAGEHVVPLRGRMVHAECLDAGMVVN